MLQPVLGAFDITILIAPAIGIVAIFVSVYLWWRGRAPKAISYRLTTPAVVSVHHGVRDQISVLYAGEPVRDVRLLNLRIANTGNGDIKPEDFESPFSVALGKSARVLGPPTVGNTNPPELEPELSVQDRKLVIAPLLLNGSRSWRGGEGDSFEVTALVSQLSEDDQLTARIAGVPRLENAETTQWQTSTPLMTRAATFVALGLITLAMVTVTPLLVEDVKSHSRIALRTGGSLCGDILRVDKTTLVLKLKGSGTVRTIPLSATRSIKDDVC